MFALAGWFLATFIMVLPNPGKKIAFGDVKMMGAVGACLGWVKMLICFFYFSIIYGLIAAVLIAEPSPKNKSKVFGWYSNPGSQSASTSPAQSIRPRSMKRAKQKYRLVRPLLWVLI